MGLALAPIYPNRILPVVVIVVGTALGLEARRLLRPDRHGRAANAFVKAPGGISGISIGQMLSFPLRLKTPRGRRLDLRFNHLPTEWPTRHGLSLIGASADACVRQNARRVCPNVESGRGPRGTIVPNRACRLCSRQEWAAYPMRKPATKIDE